jgi:hypothetical protein
MNVSELCLKEFKIFILGNSISLNFDIQIYWHLQ